MGVAVLNPRDCLQNPLISRQGLLSPPPRVRPSRNPNPNRNNRAAQPSRRKRSPNSSSSASPPRAVVHPSAGSKDLVMGQVKILKRGEKIPTENDVVVDLDLGSTHRLGPDPLLVPTRIRLAETKAASGFYAGSAFVTSPPPSSLPLPAFFMKRTAGIDDDATSDLRRILGLGL
ncbi:hypothetical protein M5689_011925 [Euphorbia peplus]|nr:hypothetical protein M5689_011925 [Euphorbia peplus]